MDGRIGVLQPRLDGRGGLEKYCVYFVQVLAERAEVDLVTVQEVDRSRLEKAFNVSLDKPQLKVDPRCWPLPPTGGRIQRTYEQWRGCRDYAELSNAYDLAVGHAMDLPWASGARRSALICHFPMVRRHRLDPQIPATGWRSLLTSSGREQREIRHRVNSWSRIIVSSEFARKWVGIYWQRDAEIINPPIEQPDRPDLSQKKNWIVGAGYFARPSEPGDPWSFKRQELLIDTFRDLCDRGLRGWELHLAGHLMLPSPDAEQYLDELRARAPGYPIFLHPNCPHSELLDLYRHGSIFWHAVGYGLDQEQNPERTEHFGMVTAEAMGYGCVPVVVNMGGQPEIVERGRSGELWNTPEECCEITHRLTSQPEALRTLAEGAVRRAGYFSVDRFRQRVHTFLDEELRILRSAG